MPVSIHCAPVPLAINLELGQLVILKTNSTKETPVSYSSFCLLTSELQNPEKRRALEKNMAVRSTMNCKQCCRNKDTALILYLLVTYTRRKQSTNTNEVYFWNDFIAPMADRLSYLFTTYQCLLTRRWSRRKACRWSRRP